MARSSERNKKKTQNMKVAIYTLTRDRLEYTKHSFKTLKEKSWYDYDHFIIDNGSTDGTQQWLKLHESEFKKVILLPENVGISKGSNMALDIIFETDKYDLIVKMDNDCEVVSDNIIGQLCQIFEDSFSKSFGNQFVLSPRVEGISKQPKRDGGTQLAGRTIGFTSIVGGLFHVVPSIVYSKYRYPEHLPKAWGQDDHFCHWAKKNGCKVGYVEGLVVNHFETTDGQAKRFPEYFERKFKEEKNA